MTGDEPAFPCNIDLRETYQGLTKRQLIAAIILGGMWANSTMERNGGSTNRVDETLLDADELLRQTESKP